MAVYIYTRPISILILMIPVFAVIIFAAILLADKFSKFQILRIACSILFIFWAAFTLYYTVFSRAQGDYGVFLKLFDSYRAAPLQPEIYRENFTNVLLFLPVGALLFLGLGKLNNILRFSISICAALIISVCIELVQFYAFLGTGEADDIMHNTLGAIIGTLIVFGCEKLSKVIMNRH